MANEFKGGGWVGVDPLAMIMGGNNNKAKLFGSALKQVASFIGTVNTVNKTISKYVDAVNNVVLNSPYGINVMKAAGQQVVTTAKNAITDLRGTGIYFLDMNSGVPPLYLFGQTFSNLKLQNQLSEVDRLLEEETTKFLAKYPSDRDAIIAAGKQGVVTKEDTDEANQASAQAATAKANAQSASSTYNKNNSDLLSKQAVVNELQYQYDSALEYQALYSAYVKSSEVDLRVATAKKNSYSGTNSEANDAASQAETAWLGALANLEKADAKVAELAPALATAKSNLATAQEVANAANEAAQKAKSTSAEATENAEDLIVRNTVAITSNEYKSDRIRLQKLIGDKAIIQEKLVNISRTQGGVAKYLRTYIDSLDDERDRSRPQLSKDSAVGCIFIMFGSPNLSNFLESYNSFKSLLYSMRPSPSDGASMPLKNLVVKYLHNEDIDNDYMESSSMFDKGAKEYKARTNKTDDPDAVIVTINQNVQEIEEIIGVEFDTELVALAKNVDTIELPSSSTLDDVKNFISGSKLPVYSSSFAKGEEDRYKYKKIICILNKEKIKNLGLDADYMSYFNNCIYYHANKSIVTKLRDITRADNLTTQVAKLYSIIPDTKCIVFEKNAEKKGERGDALLSWEYPAKTNFILRNMGDVTYKFDKIYILKKKILRSDFLNNLNLDMSNGLPDTITYEHDTEEYDINETLKMFAIDSNLGIRKTFWDYDNIENVEDAKQYGILGYQYSVALGYTTYSTIFVDELGFTSFPLYVTAYNNSFVSEELTNLKSEKKRILNALRNSHLDNRKNLAEELVKKYGDENTITVNKLSQSEFSNIASLMIPIDYDFSLSTPPDWASIRVGDLIPSYAVWFDRASEFLDVFFNYFKDVMDVIPETTKVFKDKMGSYSKNLTDIANGISTIVENLSKLSIGAYVMTAFTPSGGTEITKKLLSLSLTEQPGDTGGSGYLKLQTGAPPFGSKDYVGGYAILVGGVSYPLLQDIKDFVSKYFGDEVTSQALTLEAEDVPIVRNIPIDMETIENQYDTTEGPTIDVANILIDKDLGKRAAHISAAIDNLNEDDTPKLAGNMSNSVTPKLDIDLKNYDGSEITDVGYKKFKQALAEGSIDKMKDAAASLRSTGYRAPSNPDLFQNEEDKTAYNDFKLDLGQALLNELLSINMEELQGANIVIDPYEGVQDLRVDIAQDTYQIGWNGAVYFTFDPRTLSGKVYNDSLEGYVQNELYDGMGLNDTYEGSGYNTEWEGEIFDPFKIAVV